MPYTTATPFSKEPQTDGRVILRVRFTGAGEQDADDFLFIEGGTTDESVRRWAIQKLANLNNVTAVKDLASMAVGTAIDLTPIPDVPATPLELLQKDLAQTLRRHRAAQHAVVEGALTAVDPQVTNRKAAFVAAFEAVRTASNLNTALDAL